MRISERFDLGVNQYGLDFVDIDPNLDTPLYLSPHVLSSRNDKWSKDANYTIRSFFQFIINQLRANNYDVALEVFQNLREPSETCLGLSESGTSGSGIGAEYAEDILDSIVESRAVQTGLIQDLEDTIIFVEGVGKDRMSDMTTNIIREHLIKYTCEQCDLWDIPMTDDIPHGLVWSTERNTWIDKIDRALIVDDKRILLVPKSIVTRATIFTPNRYYNLPVISFLQARYQNRTGRFLTKKEIAKNPLHYTDANQNYSAISLKDFLRSFTRNHPEVFAEYKEQTLEEEKPVENYEITNDFDVDGIVNHLIDQLSNIDSGHNDANDFEKVTASIFELIFYPDLICPILQTRLNQGRKIVDITFDNASKSGIFERLRSVDRIPCTYIYIECKNYTNDPGNPELDQLLGRFSFQNGEVGILVCRNFQNMDLMLQRCSDAFSAGRGLIIPLSDNDLIAMLNNVRLKYNSDEHISAYEELVSDRVRRVRLNA